MATLPLGGALITHLMAPQDSDKGCFFRLVNPQPTALHPPFAVVADAESFLSISVQIPPSPRTMSIHSTFQVILRERSEHGMPTSAKFDPCTVDAVQQSLRLH